MLARLSLFVFLILEMPTFGCCTTWRAGEEPVQIAAQDVLVVWDAEKQIEHFVRRANFESETAPEDFGFLVPTPTQPKLSEIPDTVFHQLQEIIKPKVKVEKVKKFSLKPLLFSFLAGNSKGVAMKETAARQAGVEVLDTAFVGGFEATVLRASETGALLKWLEENGYDARPELREWLGPYVQKQWIVTTFKYACDPYHFAGSLTRASVCLSFETDAPFFPYGVPSDIRVKPENGSLLRLYFAGTERVAGEFESGLDHSWKASTRFSDRDERVGDVLEQVTGHSREDSGFPDFSWLTAFEDRTWPGGAEDPYFYPSLERDAIIPPPIVRSEITTIHFPIDLILLCLIWLFDTSA